jgi:hypothetical protein
MRKPFLSSLLLGTATSALMLASLLASTHAVAGNTVSLGGGVKCSWVLVSSNPATGSYIYTQVCRKGGA